MSGCNDRELNSGAREFLITMGKASFGSEGIFPRRLSVGLLARIWSTVVWSMCPRHWFAIWYPLRRLLLASVLESARCETTLYKVLRT
jgi:hypothetical protein